MYTHNQPTGSPNPVFTNNLSNVSQYETSWRSKFPKIPVLILAIVQLVFIVLIFILEIASLAVLIYIPTGVGIWCAIPFLVACISTFIVARIKDGSRRWATIALIAQLILLVFTFILIGITGNFVQTGGSSYLSWYSWYSYNITQDSNSYLAKYRLVQAQLAFGILLMFTGFTYVGIYIYVTIVALWKPHHTLDTAHLFRA